jgi:alpha-beta hydrolase superfamily lysophospholipase
MANPSLTTAADFELPGSAGKLHGRRWGTDRDPSYVALLCHGYGEHLGRYEWVARRLTADGAVVYAIDHVGHGLSDGERVLITDYEAVVDDFHLLCRHARGENAGLPVVLIGHSMGGMIAARYAQRFGSDLACVVLSGPVLGSWAPVAAFLGVSDIPDTPIDPSTLSRDSAVGAAYVADPLVWHGPFKRETITALQAAMDTISGAGTVATPMLWLHGEDDQLVPYRDTAPGWALIAGPDDRRKTYPGARHEIFNETNRDEVLDDVVAFVHQFV